MGNVKLRNEMKIGVLLKNLHLIGWIDGGLGVVCAGTTITNMMIR
jgi:hypothetical protein